MDAALWVSKTGLAAQDAKLAAISNNLANVNTVGFKRDRVAFEDLFYQVQRQPGSQQNQQDRAPTGIQLGTGGLARAYGGSAAKCLQGGERVALLELQRCACHLEFAQLAPFKARLGEFAAQLESEQYDASGAELVLALPAEQREPLQRLLADLSRGRSQLRCLETS